MSELSENITGIQLFETVSNCLCILTQMTLQRNSGPIFMTIKHWRICQLEETEQYLNNIKPLFQDIQGEQELDSLRHQLTHYHHCH